VGKAVDKIKATAVSLQDYVTYTEVDMTLGGIKMSTAKDTPMLRGGSFSHTEGFNTTANSFASHAEGSVTVAGINETDGSAAHAEGWATIANGNASHAEGSSTITEGLAAHAEGENTAASGYWSHGEGYSSTANNTAAHAEGWFTTASGSASHAEGSETNASGQASHTEGYQTISIGKYSHAEGHVTEASGEASHAEGDTTTASGVVSHAEGGNATASGEASHAEGNTTTASGEASHAEGGSTTALASCSHAEGIGTTAGVDNENGLGAHAEGNTTNALGGYSHAEGGFTTAQTLGSHAEGIGTTALSAGSHAEGFGTTAGVDNDSGHGAHSEGLLTLASGTYSHAEGQSTTASGIRSHAEGGFTIADALNSHAEGFNTNTLSYPGAHIMGQYGAADAPYSWFLANGTGPDQLMGLGAKIIGVDPSAAPPYTGLTNGYIDGTWFTGGADYAEMFETIDGQTIAPGYFVTLDGEKIREAEPDDYILGVTSINYSVLANSGELRWKDKYLTDEWGRIQKEDVVIPAETADTGNVIIPEHTEIRPVLNPDWDNTLTYIPRLRRTEWVPVGLLGQILVRHDGTCQVNGYCSVGNGGIATAALNGYRVLKRVNDTQILIMFR